MHRLLDILSMEITIFMFNLELYFLVKKPANIQNIFSILSHLCSAGELIVEKDKFSKMTDIITNQSNHF